MNEVKRFVENFIPGHPAPVVQKPDGYLCLYDDLEAERKAHNETRKRLEELEDAISAYDSQHDEMTEADGLAINQAIQNSRAKKTLTE